MKPRRATIWVTSAALMLAVAGGIIWWKQSSVQGSEPTRQELQPGGNKALSGFALVEKIFKRGGEKLETAEALEWLDGYWRLRKELPPSLREKLCQLMADPIPHGMDPGIWHHLYNSACNAMTAGGIKPDGIFLELLEKDALEGRDQVIRLYALQHLGRHRTMMGEEHRKKVGQILEKILSERSSGTAGTALVLKRQWDDPGMADKGAEETALSTHARSLEIAGDRSRPIDVRTTAILVAGDFPDCLELCRKIAIDGREHVLLRKAALHLVGKHGAAEDLPLLAGCSNESPRLSQAAEPALKKLKARLDGKPEPAVRPIFEPSGIPRR